MRFGWLAAAAAMIVSATPASAVVFLTGVDTIDSNDRTQSDRLYRDGLPSTWAATKTFPGTIAQNPTYYASIAATYTANALQTIYYEITYSSTNANASVFSAAYLNRFDPTNLASNYIGDGGNSVSATTQTYQVVVNRGDFLLLNFHNVGTTPIDYTFSVAAFSDANRGENFLSAVPEPASWAMMILGVGAIGGALRRKRVRVAYG